MDRTDYRDANASKKPDFPCYVPRFHSISKTTKVCASMEMWSSCASNFCFVSNE